MVVIIFVVVEDDPSLHSNTPMILVYIGRRPRFIIRTSYYYCLLLIRGGSVLYTGVDLLLLLVRWLLLHRRGAYRATPGAQVSVLRDKAVGHLLEAVMCAVPIVRKGPLRLL